MIKIERSNLDEIAKEYLSKLSEIENPSGNCIMDAYNAQFNEIVLAKPEELNVLNTNFMALFDQYSGEMKRAFSKEMNNQYEKMRGKHGYWLAEKLNVNTCPYCNRSYTFTLDKLKRTRPQFDHFFPKSKYPHLALSFYNLIPCCAICNHIKKDEVEFLLHPYLEGFANKFGFRVNYEGLLLEKDKIRLQIGPFFISQNHSDFEQRCQNNVKTFALAELYEKHTDHIEELIIKAYSYNQEYYRGLIEDFSRIGKSGSEIHRLIFGNYMDIADHEKRPLSKLTSDILEQIGLKD